MSVRVHGSHVRRARSPPPPRSARGRDTGPCNALHIWRNQRRFFSQRRPFAPPGTYNGTCSRPRGAFAVATALLDGKRWKETSGPDSGWGSGLSKTQIYHLGAFSVDDSSVVPAFFFLGEHDQNYALSISETHAEHGCNKLTPVRLFAFSSSKQAPRRVCDGCAHRITAIAAATPPLQLKLSSAPGPGDGGVS